MPAHISAPFIRRPVATTLLTIAVALAGTLGLQFLPVSPLPQVEFPTVSSNAGLPGASPETMASSVATPLERQFGRIAGVNEMTSTSSLGSTSVTLQFDMNRNVDSAARDVQAAINAARGQLPANLPNNPGYRKVNPAESPILMFALTSDTYGPGRIYDAASTVLAQKIAQVEGVGQVFVGGGANPAVRVELNPTILNKYGIGLDQVRAALNQANANRPKGMIADATHAWYINTTDQLFKASEYKKLIVAYRNGAAVRLEDVADEVTDSVEDLRNTGQVFGKRAVLLMVNRQPGANIIETSDRVLNLLPVLKASISPAIHVDLTMDRTTTIRASLRDTERTLITSISLVILVVFLFLRNVRATIIPSIAVPLSLLGTCGVMYMLDYSLDNLSLMALTICTGFVVDDAIVVIENISRYRETGIKPFEAAMRGSKEIGFTVLSMSTSLVAVFIPILLMGGIVGRLFREFAVTLAAAIAVSLVVSLTTTPMLCARFLKAESEITHGFLYRLSERGFQAIRRSYERALRWVLAHPAIILATTLLTIGLNVYLFVNVPKGFFPQQDTGRLTGSIQADQDISFQAMRGKLAEFVKIIGEDPAVAVVQGFTGGGFGGGAANTGRMFIALKDLEVRKVSADQVMARLRGKLGRVPGAALFLQPVQDLRMGGRSSGSLYQFTLQSDNLKDLNEWAPKMMAKLKSLPQLVDVNSDQQNRGLEAQLVIDRDTASRLQITPQMIDDSLYDAFGQRQVSTMYMQLNQYRVVMEVAPRFWQNPSTLQTIYVRSATGAEVPLSAFTQYRAGNRPLQVNHQSQFPSITFSFNLPIGTALGQAVDAIIQAEHDIGLPANVQASFQGAAQAFQDSLSNQPILIALALITVYIVLGVLYESLIHPITILSTLPSAGVGALLALMLTKTELSVIAMIGMILLIGIVEKNAIMMIDFALEAQRRANKSPEAAIFDACLLRFRPIMMTTMAAMLGGLPLALGTGTGSEMRRPLGIAIVGGLIVSQAMTLFTTPVVYLYLDRLRLWGEARRARLLVRAEPKQA